MAASIRPTKFVRVNSIHNTHKQHACYILLIITLSLVPYISPVEGDKGAEGEFKLKEGRDESTSGAANSEAAEDSMREQLAAAADVVPSRIGDVKLSSGWFDILLHFFSLRTGTGELSNRNFGNSLYLCSLT